MVYTYNMVFISRPENFAITQKYASLACDTIMEPAPIASTQRSGPWPACNPNVGSNGNTIEDAVMMATVEDPCAVFKMLVIRKGKKMPRLARVAVSLK